MKSAAVKYSRFWIYQYDDGELAVTSLPISFNDESKVIPVIEISALEAERARSEKLVDEIQDLLCQGKYYDIESVLESFSKQTGSGGDK